MRTKITRYKKAASIVSFFILASIFISPAKAACVASFTYTVNSSGVVTFVSSSTTGSSPSYVWNFGDGGFVLSANATHPYSASGTYTVCLSIFDNNDNSCSSMTCQVINVTVPSMEIKQYEETANLFASYPNPFSNSTSISYSIDKSSMVQLIVYDLLGNKVEMLENEMKQNGIYTKTWQADNVVKGIYLLQLKINGQHAVSQKLILTK
jgi:PKD repeat protein